MTNEIQSEPQHSEVSKRSVLNDAKLLKEEFSREAHGLRTAQQARFAVSTAFLLYWGYFAFLCGAAYILLPHFSERITPRVLLYAAGAVFLARNANIAAVYYCKTKFGALVEMTVSSALRTGIPLTAVLVFYLAIDKILLKSAVLTLFGFYVLTLPFEVWLFLPRPGAAQKAGNSTAEDKE